jgi:hypothetical protein
MEDDGIEKNERFKEMISLLPIEMMVIDNYQATLLDHHESFVS